MYTYHPINKPKSIDQLKWEYIKVYWSFLNPFALYDFFFKCQHDFDDTKEIKKEVYEDHPHTSKYNIYVVTTRECKCGKIVYDAGLEMRETLTKAEYMEMLNG